MSRKIIVSIREKGTQIRGTKGVRRHLDYVLKKSIGEASDTGGASHSQLQSNWLCERSHLHQGKPIRRLVISAERIDDRYEREIVVSDLIDEAERLVQKFFPGARYLIAGHGDTLLPHVHVAVENYDAKKKRTWNISPTLCSLMQRVEFWTQKFISGKGNGAGKPASSRGKEIQAFRLERSSKREITYKALRDHLKAARVPPDRGRIAAYFEARNQARTRTKKGGDLRRPSIVFDGKKIRIDTFLRWNAEFQKILPRNVAGKGGPNAPSV